VSTFAALGAWLLCQMLHVKSSTQHEHVFPSATLAVQADSRSHEVAETDSGVLTTVVPVSRRLLCAPVLSVMTMQCITRYFELSCKSQLQLQTSSS